ncbi:cadherin-like domain-containing protein [Methylomonas sp. OY6]|uniref:Cadherin-like domain-containing protein n=1 Tax=Methylomonas defluvii TaxID=3045149 RepID=A0ABU4UJC7_9GAMM|nr:cadherin-like domain-containing protein [Methylomonas sp. OY6]MDX8129561.1 cadherin-like domain-containing protein [Methylomonas sp. OY6]
MNSKSHLKHYHSKPILEELESRQLFSGGIEGLLTEQLMAPNATYANATPPADTQQPPVQTSASETSRNEIVFVDTRVQGYESLLNDIKSSDVSNRNLEIITLDNSTDGIQQITQILAERDNLDAVHIISHGSDGSLDLGNSQLNFDTLIQNQTDISAWGDAFNIDGDILIYGCNVAETQFGQSFVEYLSGITNIDVAASEDTTGSADLGGDWLLEYQTGDVETEIVVSTAGQSEWTGLMAVTANGTVTSTSSTSTNQMTWSHTVSAGFDRVLFVEIAIDDGSAGVNSVKYGTADLTRVGRTAANHAVEIWALVNPTEGTDNVVISFTGNTEAAAGASTFNGVNQSTPYGTYAGNTGTTGLLGGSGTVNVASATGDLVIDVQYWKAISAVTSGTGQTSQWSSSPLLSTAKAGSSVAEGASSVTMSGSALLAADWSIGAVSIKASINTAPVNTVPVAQTTNEDTAKVFSSANGNAITITDADAGGANNEITLTVTNGTLTLGGTTGLTFVAGDGTADNTMRFRGTASAINTALNGLSFTPTAEYSGSATLTLATKDSVLLSLDIDTGLLGRYAFDNTSALETDSSPAAGSTVSVVNGTSVNDTTRGNVLSLAGDGYVQTTGVYGQPSSVTLAAWVNLTSADTGGAEVISLGDNVILRLDAGGKIKGSYVDSGTFRFTETATTLAGTGWHHVAYTIDSVAHTQAVYIDGVAVASTAYTTSIAYNQGTNSFIGKHGNGGTTYDFNGKIDEARIYNRALTGAEIAALAGDLTLTDTDTVAITVTAVNDAPLISAIEATTLAYTENGAATAITSGLVLTDVDNANLSGATVQITGNYASGQDVLAFTNQNGITGSWNSSTGTLTLSGTATVSQYQTALRSVTYQNTSDAPSTASRTVSFSVTDGTTASNTGTRSISVAAVNDAPVLSFATGSVSYPENAGAVILAPTATVTDADSTDFNGGQLVVSFSANGQAEDRLAIRNQGTASGQIGVSGSNVSYGGVVMGTFTGGTDGTTPLVISFNSNASVAAAQALGRNITYQNVSDAPSNLVRTLQGYLTDGDGGTSNVVSGTLSIIASNDAPVVTSASLTLSEGQTVTLSAANVGVTDPDNNSFTYTVSNVSGGIFQLTTNPGFNINSFTSTQLSNNQVQFVDDGNEVAPSFSVTVSDGSANSNTLAATINYTAANEAPTDIAETRYLSEQSYLTKSMYDLTLDTGHSGYGIVLDGVSYARGLGTHPAASGNGYGYVDYAVNGATSFKATIGINDYQTGSYGKVQFYVYVDGVQTYSSPILNSTSTPIDLNIDVTGASTLRLAIDNANNGNAFDHGVWANARLEGGTVALASIAENTAIGTVIGSVVGVDNDLRENWSYALINDAGGRFAINANTGQITVANDSLLNYEAATSHDIIIRATDTGGLSVDKTFTISLADVNEVPVISSASLTLNEGDTVTLSSANFGVSDPDNAGFTYTVSSVSGGYFQLSSAAGNSITQFTSADLSGGLVQFVDDGNEVAPSFSMTVSDGALNSNTLAATIHYTAVNDNAPAISSGGSASVNENSPINTVVYTATGSDADGNPLTWSLSGTDAGLLTIDANSGAVTLNAFADYESKSSYSFDVVASDGTLSSSLAVTLAVVNLNDNPVSAISDSNATANSIAENTANGTVVGITALASDADTGATISYSLTDNAGGRFAIDSSTGVVTVADGGLLDYESATNHSITLLATSSDGSTDSQSFTINITNLNDNAPVLSATNLTLSEGQTVTLNAANFVVSDADSSDFTFTISALTGGYFQLTTAPGIAITSFTGAQLAANQVQFVDDANEAPPNFNATASDGTLHSNTLAATINYSALNDVPVLTSASLTLNEGETVTLAAANFGVTDPDNASVTYALSSVSGGYFQLTTNPGVSVTSFNSTQLAAGQVQFVDDSNEVAPRFDVTVSDGSLSSNTLSATIYYTGINDAPIINNLGLTVSEGETVTLSAAHFGITDPDSDSFTYTVGDVTGGYFQLASRAGLPITGFTSAQLTANQVQFIDDGNNESAPSFSLSVNDGLSGSTTVAATINYVTSTDTTDTFSDIITYNQKNGLNDKNQGDDAQTNISPSQHAPAQQFATVVDFKAYTDQSVQELSQDKQATGNRFILESNAWIDNGNSPRLSGLMDTNKNEEPRRNETSRKYHFESRIPSVDEYRIDSQTTLSEQEEVEFWNRLENIHKQMSDPTVVEDANPVNIKIILGTSAGLTAGFVSWILRAGSLMASFMSTVPLLKRFDPLPIMRSVKKSRLAKDHEAKELDSVSSHSEETP